MGVVTLYSFFVEAVMQQVATGNKGGGTQQDFIPAQGTGTLDFDRVRDRLNCTGCYMDHTLAQSFVGLNGVGDVPVLGRVPEIRGIRVRLPNGIILDLKAGYFQKVYWN